jgi:hypothetical protein
MRSVDSLSRVCAIGWLHTCIQVMTCQNVFEHTPPPSIPVYLDSQDLASYHARLRREDGARAVRLRW